MKAWVHVLGSLTDASQQLGAAANSGPNNEIILFAYFAIFPYMLS